ncbi:MAG: hypothetical protein HC859_00375 [Bacteroidia bacterium]|nr:hypothetical protein [Bacteroidia bacterium]
MNSQVRQYLFAGIFLMVAIYELFEKDWLEFSLYAVVGTAFVVNALSREPRLAHIRKALVIASWTFILASGILLLYVLQFRF